MKAHVRLDCFHDQRGRVRGDSPRFLHLPSVLRHTLLLQRIQHGVFHEPVLDRGELGQIEQALGTCLPDNVLATFASTGRPLPEVLRCNERALQWSDFPTRYTAFASQSSDEAETFWCTLVARQPLARLGLYRWVPGRHSEHREVNTAGWVAKYYRLTPSTDEELAQIQRLSVQFYPRVEGPIQDGSGIRELPTNHG